MRKGFAVVAAVLCGVSAWGQPSQAQSDNPQPSAEAPAQRIALSPGVEAGNRVGGDNPVYPAIAKAAQIQGTVVLHAIISKQGEIRELHVISGPPMLQESAKEAVTTWHYKPYLLKGEPVEVETQINVVFSLASRRDATDARAAGAAVPDQSQPVSPSPDTKPPEHPITVEQVHEMMEMTGAVGLTKEALDSLMPTLKQSMPPYLPADVLEDFEKTLLDGRVIEKMVIEAYQAHLSSADAAEIITFYKTAAGQRMLAVMPEILKDTQEAGQKAGLQTMTEVLQRHKAEIDEAKEKYDQQHPWSPPKN